MYSKVTRKSQLLKFEGGYVYPYVQPRQGSLIRFIFSKKIWVEIHQIHDKVAMG